MDEFVKIMVDNLPTYNGYDIADRFTKFFISKLPDLTGTSIVDVLKVYSNNRQCIGRRSHVDDMEQIKEYCSKISLDVKDFISAQSSDCNNELLQEIFTVES